MVVDLDGALHTSDSYASYIFNEWRDILYLSERVRTNFFYFLDKTHELDDFKASNDEKEELYAYASKLVGLYSALYSKVMERDDFKNFKDEFKMFERYHEQPFLLLQESTKDDGYVKLMQMERVVGRALERLKLLTFERVD